MKTTLLILAAVCGIAGILLMLSEPSEACTTYEWVQVFLGTRALGAVLIMPLIEPPATCTYLIT